MGTRFTFEDIEKAPKPQSYHLPHYNTAIKLAQHRCAAADVFEEPIAGIGGRVNGEFPMLQICDTPASDYWDGVIEGINAKINFNWDRNSMEEEDVGDIRTMSEFLKGKIAGYMLYELRNMIPNDYEPPQVDGLDCSPIRWLDLLPKFGPHISI